MMNKYLRTFIILCLPVTALLSACGGTEEPVEIVFEPCEVRAGVIVKTSSDFEKIAGYQFAQDEINEHGGVAGCELELVFRYDEGSAETAQRVVRELIKDELVHVVIGASGSSTTIAAASVSEVFETPFIVPTASSDFVTERGFKWIFRINATASQYAAEALDFIFDYSGVYVNIAVIYEETTFGESAAVSFAEDALQRGFTLDYYKGYDSGTFTDHGGVMRELAQIDPDIIVFAINNTTHAVNFMLAADQLEVNPDIFIGMAGSYINPSFVERAGMHADYIIATGQWAPNVNWEGSEEFVNRYFTKYGFPPGPRAVQTYASLFVFKAGVEQAFTDYYFDNFIREERPGIWNWPWSNIEDAQIAIRDAMGVIDLSGNTQSIFGDVDFDPNTGQNNHQVILLQIRNGDFYGVYPSSLTDVTPIIPIPQWWERHSFSD